jgi:heme-degrading monooxygenase HmoA
MYARTTQLEIDLLRTSLDSALRSFEETVLPELRQQPGFRGVYVLTTPDGKALLVSFWSSAEAADASSQSGWYTDVLARFTTLFRSPPGRERYEVRIALPPELPDAVTTTSS